MQGAFPVIVIDAASHREFGLEYGKKAKDLIVESVANYKAIFEGDGISMEEAKKLSVERYLPVVAKEAPELVEEMQGLAEGAGVSFEEILAVNSRTEVLANKKEKKTRVHDWSKSGLFWTDLGLACCATKSHPCSGWESESGEESCFFD